ncbi:hypothetical protein [Actinoplanes sp. NPDC049118]|uniref:hypothetical protein n=1 Tax=Actinoplanes sp. NPDC049118 TaxID=3155769 RepID=UPI0033C4C595
MAAKSFEAKATDRCAPLDFVVMPFGMFGHLTQTHWLMRRRCRAPHPRADEIHLTYGITGGKLRASRLGTAYLVAALLGLTMGTAEITQAHAYTDEVTATCQSTKAKPSFTFNKGDAPYGTLYAYYTGAAYCGSTLMATRHRVKLKAGSGDGSSDSCRTNHGWLPNGDYPARYERNHQTDSDVVKGSVWSLGNKRCSDGTNRTELFIHSQGGNGGSWAERNYKSQGCIKINQSDRTYLKGLWDRPIYGASSAKLKVTS